MIFYSEEKGHFSHMVRIVLAEKDISCEIKEFDPDGKLPEELATLSPYNKSVSYTHLTLPTIAKV